MHPRYPAPTNPPGLVLASSSRYRRQLLDKLGLPYRWQSPDVDERPQPGESPEALVQRLALAKAQALAAQYPNSLIIGSDQVAWCAGQILGKPGHLAGAQAQLQAASGTRVTFYTGLCLLDTRTGSWQVHCEPYQVYFRDLSQAQINHYLQREQPYDCAGSFKSEGLGITLFRKLEGDDPNALVGLPLIALTTLLCQAGLDPLGSTDSEPVPG